MIKSHQVTDMIMNITKYKHTLLFYILATIIPWGLWFIAGYISHITPYTNSLLRIVGIFGLIGLLGPAGVAWWLVSRDSNLRVDVLRRFFNFRSAKPIYFLIALFLMPISILLAQAISLLFGYSASQFAITGHFTFTSGIFPVWALLIIAPILEELGWHSYGTDALRSKMNLFKTSLLFALFWGIWHIPLSTIQGYYQSNLVLTGWIYSVNFLVSIFPFVFLMNWLYYKTNRNIILAMVFHITAGFFNEIFATNPDSKVVQTGLLLIFAVIVVIREKDLFFNKN